VMLPYLLLTMTATLNILGTLKGFAPAIYEYMSESQLSLWLAVINLLMLAVMLVYLLLDAWRKPAPGGFVIRQKKPDRISDSPRYAPTGALGHAAAWAAIIRSIS
jgi:ABC-type Fe3+ transport system permease subunit